MNKEKHYYVILQHYNPGELLKEIPPYLKRDFWYKRSNLKIMTMSKNGSKIKTPSSKSLILVSFCWKKKVLLITALTNLIKSLISLKLVIESVSILSGPPCIIMIGSTWSDRTRKIICEECCSIRMKIPYTGDQHDQWDIFKIAE